MFNCILLLAWCCAAVWAVPSGTRQYDLRNADQLFEEFLRLHQKQYESENEKQTRFGIFLNSLERINKLNMESKTAVYGINKFADQTLEELHETFTGLRHGPIRGCKGLVFVGDTPTNNSFDWRDENKVTKVKDQKRCSSSWAFSTIGNLEGLHAIKNKELKELSVSQLLDCNEYASGCFGGSMDIGVVYLKNNGGIMSEEDYSSTDTNENEKVWGCKFNETKVQTTVANCYYPLLPSNNETKLEEYLVKIGPLSIGVDAKYIFNYESGILDNCYGEEPNAGMLLVGYGEEDGVPYWIVKNSWGENWGEKGYMRIRKHYNCLRMTDVIVTASLDKYPFL